jgi:hypothetical protein
VWNGNSISTPCRLVFDASQATNTGYSLNDIVAKGTNNMNKLIEIIIRWSSYLIGFHTDIQKMYNTIKLNEEHWCLQRYIWQRDLIATEIPVEKVIKTLIYGVRSSGNQAEYGLRETSRLSAEEYPEVHRIVKRDVYVDDCLSGECSVDMANQRADQLEVVLNRGGFSLKGITFSKQKPSEKLSEDGNSINVAGMKWYPQEDQISLDISELNFAKKTRGKKPNSEAARTIPRNLTRRHCVAKVAEIFDISGKLTPITAGMKLDLHELVQRGLDWDDIIPDNLRAIWKDHFEMMKEIPQIKYNRCIVPEDAASLDIETIGTGDASQSIACAAIYARYKRKNGNFSCQLVFARSKILPAGTTQPRAELIAATLNTHTGVVVKKAFGDYHKKRIKLTDSQIKLYWINNEDKWLKTWVRNRIIEIRRLTSIEEWYYVSTKLMIADIGTRKGVSLQEVKSNSAWINGYEWMKKPLEDLPIMSINQVKLTNEEVSASSKEQHSSIIDTKNHNFTIMDIYLTKNESRQKGNIPKEVQSRYMFSDYIIDPNRFTYSKVVNIIGYVIKFIQNTFKRVKSAKITNQLVNTKDPNLEAENYFFKKSSQEVEKFVEVSKYKKISTLKDGILYYTGRIPPNKEVNCTGNMSSVMLDLTQSTFCVPVVDKHSPLAYSIVNDIHWNHKVAKHSGVETTHRYVLQKAYIIEGRDLIKTFRRKCERCRYLTERTIEVVMGPISTANLNIAPAFYSTQVDLCGPFNSYSNHHKRTTIKIC